MVLPDLHLPNHDRQALRVVMEAHRLLKPRTVVILGDWLDCGDFSSHSVRFRAERVAGSFVAKEIGPCRDLLERFEKHSDVVYIEGNHEARVETMITKEGGAWSGVADLVSPQALLSAGRRRKFTWVPYMNLEGSIQHYRIAKDLIATHGWSCCKHASAKHLSDVGMSSVVHGHTHRKQSATLREPLTGRVHHGWSPGTLSKLQPLWMTPHPTQWVHGFSLVWVKDDKTSWTSYSPTINRGKCILPDGTRVDGK